MEHIVQFTFSVDDAAIQQKLEAQAVAEVTKRFDQAVIKEACRARYGYCSRQQSFEDSVTWFLQSAIDQFVKDNADKIVNAAAVMLSERLARTKRAKEMLEEAVKKVSG